MCLVPMLVFLVGVEVFGNGAQLTVWKGRGDAVHEVDKFDATTLFLNVSR